MEKVEKKFGKKCKRIADKKSNRIKGFFKIIITIQVAILSRSDFFKGEFFLLAKIIFIITNKINHCNFFTLAKLNMALQM
jgi:hypothetical protein